jgi:hypothetical protein
MSLSDSIKSSLAAPSNIVPINDNVILSGPCLDSSSHDSLLRPVTNELIQQTLSSIGNDKSLGPDGYISLFFKKAWGIVRGDFCTAIKDFFASGKMLKQVNHSIISLVPKSTTINLALSSLLFLQCHLQCHL